MDNNIEFSDCKFGIKAVIKTSWKSSFLNILKEKIVKELELNDGKGWKGDNVDFLQMLPNLKSLIIIDFKMLSIEAIHNLNELENLEVMTYCKKPVDFKSFPKLLNCSFEWIKGSESLFEMKNIQELFINSYKGKDSKIFSKLVDLEQLSILNSSIENLNGISILNKLKSLRLANLKKIKSLKPLENLNQLEELKIQKCKEISDLSPIFELSNLKHLLLLDLGDIASISGVENLQYLKDFLFYESTNVLDGDLNHILKLKSLEKISFQNRRHYSHKREFFWETMQQE